MDKYLSKTYRILALVMLSYPVVYFLQSVILFDIPFRRVFSILVMPIYLVASLTGVSAGVGLLRVKQWSYSILLFNLLVTFILNGRVLMVYGETHHKTLAYFFSMLIFSLVFLRIRKEIKVPYFIPKLRWWESFSAQRFSLPVKLTNEKGEILEDDAEILDISKSGVFVRTIKPYGAEQEVLAQFNLMGEYFEFFGTIVWLAESSITHPKGIGIKFFDVSRKDRLRLKAAIRGLKNETANRAIS